MAQNINSNEKLGYQGMYLERNGENARQLLDELMRPPELPLDESERLEALQFEASLSELPVGDETTMDKLISSWVLEEDAAPFFFAKPFIDGKIDLSHHGAPTFNSETEVYQWISEQIQSGYSTPKQLAALAKSSLGHYKKEVAADLVSGKAIDTEALSGRPFVLDPQKLIETRHQLTQARRLLLEERSIYKEGGERLDGAKRAISDVYLARVNELIAQSIPRTDYLVDQSRLIGDVKTATEAVNALPSGLKDGILNEKTRPDVLRRLDFLRNGMTLNERGEPSGVNPITLVPPEERQEAASSMFSPEQRRVLKSVELQPEATLTIFTNILSKAKVLSAEDSSTWTDDRGKPAEDGLFQVVINPGKDSFEVVPETAVYKVSSVPRSIYDIMVIGGFHELQHVNQAFADREIGESLRIGRIKGKRVSMIREAGANIEQRGAERAYFGVSKPFATSYATALEALERGTGMAGAITAFYDEKRATDSEITPEKAAEMAADRVVRLVRQGGVSSQPMVYAEEAILNAQLAGAPLEVRQRATAITSLDLVDQARLHKYGLLPEASGEKIDWAQLVLEELQPYIDEALSTSSES